VKFRVLLVVILPHSHDIIKVTAIRFRCGYRGAKVNACRFPAETGVRGGAGGFDLFNVDVGMTESGEQFAGVFVGGAGETDG